MSAAALESAAARDCATNANDQQIADLDRTAKALDAAYAGGDVEAILQAKSVFYDALFAGAGNGCCRKSLLR